MNYRSWSRPLSCLALMCIMSIGALAAEDTSVNESVLSAINERLVFLNMSPVTWPNNIHGVAPGLYPKQGFYVDDDATVALALRTAAISYTNQIRGSFVYFSGNMLPDTIPGPLNTAQPPFDTSVGAIVVTSWVDMVRVLRAARFVAGSVSMEYQVRFPFTTVNPPPDIGKWTPEQQLDWTWEHILLNDWTNESPGNRTPGSAYLLDQFVTYQGSYMPEGFTGDQTHGRFVVSGSAANKPIAVYPRGFDPAIISAKNQNQPGLIPADGNYHRYATMNVPSTGDWIDGPRPDMAISVIPDFFGMPGYDLTTYEGYSLGLSWGNPLGYIDGQFRYPSDASESPPDPGSCDKVSSTGSSPGAPSPADGQTSIQVSLTDNVLLTYRHWADDYHAANDVASCRSCSGGGGTSDALPCLAIRRIHRYDLIGAPSSMGPGVFLAEDISLVVPLPGVISIIDPQANLRVNLQYDAIAAAWGDASHNLAAGIQLSGQPAPGETLTYTLHDGTSFTWEFINDGTYQLRGRLVARSDRNGNAMSISYVYSPTASTAVLGGNRVNLWRIASLNDAHGQSALITYAATMVAGRPVISRIDLPNGSAITYHYNQPALGFASQDLVGFSGASLPGGDEVTVNASIDGGLVRVAFNDPGADGQHRRKTVWLTPPNAAADPRTGNPAGYRIQSAAFANGECAYRCRLEPSGSNWATIVQEGARLLRLTHTAAGRILQTERATAWAWDQPSATYTWEVTGTYTWDSQIRPTDWTDASGTHYHCTPDQTTNAPARIDHDDGTYAAFTYNAFAEPVTAIDRTGVQTVSTYDVNGNRLSETVGAGTDQAATTQWTYNGRGQVLSMTNPMGAVTSYSYTPAGYVETMTEPPDHPGDAPAVWRYTYDAVGRRISATDPRGITTTYQWDQRNRLVGTTYADGSTETTTYGTGVDANLVVRRTDRDGRITAIDYDDAGRAIVTMLYANQPAYEAGVGQVLMANTYLPGTTLETDVWRLGEKSHTAYDGRSRRIASTVWATGTQSLTSQTTYDATDHPWLSTDPYGRRTIQLYDADGRVVRVIRELVIGGLPTPLPTPADLSTLARDLTPNPAYVIEDSTYDAEGRLLTRRDGRGVDTAYTYTVRGDQATVTEAAGVDPATTISAYDAAGRRILMTSPRGVSTQTIYTGRSLVQSVTEALGTPDEQEVSTRTYSPTRKVLTEADALHRVTTYTYGGCCDRLVGITDPAGFVTAITYDPVGNRLTVTNPNGLTTTMAYDSRNRVVTTTNAAGETTVTTYDDDLTDGIGLDADPRVAALLPGLGFSAGWADGSAVAVTNPAQETIIDVYDGLGRPVLHLDPLGHATRIAYDAVVGNLIETAQTDPLGRIVRRRTDAAGLARQSVDALGSISSAAFDAAGNQVSATDANGVGWSAIYNPRNRLLSRTQTRSDATGPGTTGWSYDLDGNRTAETDAVGKIEAATYDLRNRRLTTTDRIGAVTRFAYDAVGNLLTITDAEGGVTSYGYDVRNLLTQETFPGPSGGTRSYTYDPGRRLLTRTQQTASVGGN